MSMRVSERPVGAMRPGDHAAFPFATTEEQVQVVGRFLREGLDTGQKVLYVSDAPPRHLPGLGHRPDTDRAAGTGQLRAIPREHACLTRGRFDPDRMRTVIGDEIVTALDEGYDAVRLTADMSWVLTETGGLARMMQSETGFDVAMAAGVPLMAICQLDRGRCPADQLNVLVDGHPLRVTPEPEYDDGVLRITRSHAPAGLRLAGELDAARHGPLLEALTALARPGGRIHLDFAGVRFVDLGTLSRLVTHAMRPPARHVLVLDDLPPDVAAVIETLGWRYFPGLAPGRPRP